ncbi:MAG: hypothetical protein UU23_C0006G0009 [Candidatus Curtissbacteria bacterium GW2011_GWA1_40_9]|uniref:Glycosyltransferase RgtA/B/C/D-like domain-containing protein n=1 Tax=Candidatus Curtissbacteria bacterium GW2011_GWA1_40_9 TaxID=1618408 RepID=A0A0G0TLS1_9BACT|nr:MAG: hypothetical protein UU23_C0006G0009 [Candidatus Curtissbacteria bacterium GW2011_GWA1_40_9]
MYYKNPLTYLIPFLFIVLLFTNLQITKEQQFVLLAKSFQNSSLALTNLGENISDTSPYQGKYYWPLGPFPAIIILPFLFIFQNFYQSYLSFPISILNFILLFQIAKFLGLDKKKSLILSIFFIFGSIYTPLAAIPASWYFAQTVACFLTIAAIYEFLVKKSYFIPGVLIAAATATRFNLILVSIFFIILATVEGTKPTKIIKLLLPITVSVILIFSYNNLRFGNPLESGYNLQLIPQEALARRNIGLFSTQHIPSNLYYMIFKGPEAVFKDSSKELTFPYLSFNNYGLSIFFLSPILLLLHKANFKNKLIKTSTLTTFVLLIPILTYYGIGQKQVGYRYALDFFPFLFLMLTDAVKSINIKLLYLIVFWGVFFSITFTLFYISGLDL